MLLPPLSRCTSMVRGEEERRCKCVPKSQRFYAIELPSFTGVLLTREARRAEHAATTSVFSSPISQEQVARTCCGCVAGAQRCACLPLELAVLLYTARALAWWVGVQVACKCLILPSPAMGRCGDGQHAQPKDCRSCAHKLFAVLFPAS
mmetsp:Transcript_49901/g.80498  ORF Transcript_49901/g.80498 Transcript_49901/m.80498 type:complete len:149 (+) Transcript_49901:681-1127(+)